MRLFIGRKYIIRGAYNNAGKPYLRIYCAEYKIINDIASNIKHGASGKITIYVELEPCDACKNLLNRFQRDYPNIKIEVIHNNGGRIHPNR